MILFFTKPFGGSSCTAICPFAKLIGKVQNVVINDNLVKQSSPNKTFDLEAGTEPLDNPSSSEESSLLKNAKNIEMSVRNFFDPLAKRKLTLEAKRNKDL